MSEEINLTWVVAHEPLELYLRSVKTFKEIIESESDNRIKINILTKEEFCNQFDIKKYGFMRAIIKNEIQMGQFQTTAIGSKYKNFHLFDLPFLFRDHEHARKVLDGSIGENLLELLGKNTGMRGLAFTYSGGFRIMVSSKPIKTLTDIKNKILSISESPITQKMYDLLEGITVLDKEGDDLSTHLNNNPDIDFDGGETTLVRFDKVKEKTPFITNTKHSLFLTTIVISEIFWNTLSEEDKILFKNAAKKTALLERTETIEDSKNFELDAKNRCEGFFQLSDSEIQKFKDLTSEIYKSDLVKNIFSPVVLKKIIAA